MKKSKIYAGLLTAMLALPISGCAKNVDCDVQEKHIHYYQDESGMRLLINGEKETKGGYSWTDDYVLADDTNEAVANRGMFSIHENINYILDHVNSLPSSYREEYIYEYFYGTYYGYGYCYHWDGEEWTWGYGYGNVTGWHWDYHWKTIPDNVYTENKVKDITYKFKLYKLNSNGEFISKYFSSFDEIEDGYIYFKKGDFIVELQSDSYYLSPNDYARKTLIK